MVDKTLEQMKEKKACEKKHPYTMIEATNMVNELRHLGHEFRKYRCNVCRL